LSVTQGKWKPSPAIKATAIVHLGAALALGGGVTWPWAAGALLVNHLALTAAGLWPRSRWLGANLLTLSSDAQEAQQIAITIDDGPNPDVTPAVLDILDAFNAKASFFCIGTAVQANPALAREIVRRGHGVENHSYAHRHHFSLMGMGSLRREITQTQDIIAQTTGRAPQYFRAPAGLRNPLLDPVLQGLNLRLATWTRRGFDTVTPNADIVLARLEVHLAPGDILLLHDGNCAYTLQGQPVILDVLPKLLERFRQKGFHAVSLTDTA
jgi:peptidoglycan-N-acetylglucosamine deacetylase